MKNKTIFWITTSFIFLFEGVMPALTFQSEMARNGISHLGYPEYFGNILVFFKVAGTLILMIPMMPRRMKEWAYAGFTFDFVCASLSIVAVDGFVFPAMFPLIILAILVLSYVSYHKLNSAQEHIHQLA